MAGFEGLVLKVVQYCEGNPLALKVLGSSLSENNTIHYWRSQLKKLKKEMHSGIQGVLQRSYTSLPYNSEKELFLHIACFFVGKDLDYVVQILEPDYSAASGIKTLINRCLLYVSSNKVLMMHRLVQEMGKSIIRQESAKCPAKRSRVWLSSDSYKILSKGEGSKTVEGFALDMHMLLKKKFPWKSLHLKTDALNKMNHLKLLQQNFVELNGSCEKFSEDLRWLCWLGFHLRYIPSGLYMGNLVAIDMSYSKLKLFEPPTVVLWSLKILNLKDSHKLVEIRNILNIPNLETLVLWNCYNLVNVCKNLRDLSSLSLLNMTGCKNVCIWKQMNLLGTSNSGGVTRESVVSFPVSLHRLFLDDCNLECTDSFRMSLSDQFLALL
ncbi:putative P-loop containing nucleoside triphosphate hydrolase, leucine-rich repeat domain superfamily [Helianthus annuus]|nr:putative P-loop containing nucleoside triphosphate hydrolase, leucine-rich repeat domain superfamily [Helianthus annuus]